MAVTVTPSPTGKTSMQSPGQSIPVPVTVPVPVLEGGNVTFIVHSPSRRSELPSPRSDGWWIMLGAFREAVSGSTLVSSLAVPATLNAGSASVNMRFRCAIAGVKAGGASPAHFDAETAIGPCGVYPDGFDHQVRTTPVSMKRRDRKPETGVEPVTSCLQDRCSAS